MIKFDLVGNVYGDMEVISIDEFETEHSKERFGKKATMWHVKCTKCGYETAMRKCDLDGITKRGASGCNRCFGENILGNTYGRLTVIDFPISRKGQREWLCECSCDKHTQLRVSYCGLRRGNSQSCGCIRGEKLANWNKENRPYNPNRDSNSRLYNIWQGIKGRCSNPNLYAYKYYGGKGVKICDEWREWKNFKEWALNNGYQEDLTIDRIDVDGDYEPSNCRWATMQVQCNNRTHNHYITYDGRTQSLSDWCRELNLDYDRTKQRINACGMTPEQAFTLPKYYTQKYCHNDASERANIS